MRTRTILAALMAVLVFSAQASADDMKKWEWDKLYISLAGLYMMPEDSELTFGDLGRTAKSDLSYDTGVGFLAALGYGDDVGLRGEIELGRRSANFDKLTFNVGSASLRYDGSISMWTVMANRIWATEVSQLRPYVGAGAGFAFATGEEETQSWLVGDAEYSSEGDDASDTMVAYQLMLGVAYPVFDAAEIRLGYRYFGTNKGDFNGVKISLSSHNVEVGFRF